MPSIDDQRSAWPGLAGAGVVVTGGASGIGRATALLAARAGAHVLVGDVNEAAMAETTELAAAEGVDVRSVRVDVTEPASVAAMIAAVGGSHLAGVVCSAGIAPDVDPLEMALEMWSAVIAVNLTGTFLTAQAAARTMVAGGRGGSIVTVGAGVATSGGANLTHYAASKAGVVGMTKSLARAVGVHRIRVNCVAPGGVNTPLYWGRTRLQPIRADEGSRLPLQRIGEPDDLANCIGFLLSDLSPWITGQTIHVNGGSHMP